MSGAPDGMDGQTEEWDVLAVWQVAGLWHLMLLLGAALWAFSCPQSRHWSHRGAISQCVQRESKFSGDGGRVEGQKKKQQTHIGLP